MQEQAGTGTPGTGTPPGTDTSPGQQPPGTGTPPAQSQLQFINSEGKFEKGWKEHYLPEDVREDKVYDKVTDLRGTLTQLSILDKLVGRKGVLVPNEASGQTEWDNFYSAIGRPENADGYSLEFDPEADADIVEDFDGDSIKDGKALLFAAGANQRQADLFWKYEKERQRRFNQSLQEFEDSEKEEAQTALHQKWGGAYEENLHIVNRVVSENTEEGDEKDKLLAQYGNDPLFAKFIYNIGRKFMEHGIITNVETPFTDLEEQKSKLMQSEAYTNPNHPDHKKTVDKVQAIFNELAKRRPTGTPA